MYSLNHVPSALEKAIHSNDTAAVKALLRQGVNPNKDETAFRSSMILNAVIRGHMEIVQLLADYGADMTKRNPDGFNPLTQAVCYGRPEMVSLLIELGADIESGGERGYTPLIYAALHNKTEVMRVLLDNGANINARTQAGDTALSFAEKNKNEETARLLRAGPKHAVALSRQKRLSTRAPRVVIRGPRS